MAQNPAFIVAIAWNLVLYCQTFAFLPVFPNVNRRPWDGCDQMKSHTGHPRDEARNGLMKTTAWVSYGAEKAGILESLPHSLGK